MELEKRNYTYKELLLVITKFTEEVDTSCFHSHGQELTEKLEPYIKGYILRVIED